VAADTDIGDAKDDLGEVAVVVEGVMSSYFQLMNQRLVSRIESNYYKSFRLASLQGMKDHAAKSWDCAVEEGDW
jgi:hypothetical protein